MRTCLAFLLALLLSLNAAAAAVVGVCDALEHTPNHAAHFAHHSHEHADDHDHGAAPTTPDAPGSSPAAGDHHHAHVHPGFSMLLPGAHSVAALEGHSPMIAGASDRFVSAPQVRLDRPPRAALA